MPEGRKLRLAVLGASGSIGTQTLDVVRHHKDKAEIVCLSVHTRTDVAAAAAREFGCRLIAVTDPAHAHDAALEDLPEGTKVLVGPEALVELATRDDVDCVVSAVVGFAGIESSYAAAKAGKRLAYANKESIVVGGDLIMPLLRPGQLVPVDSEHSAIFQCLMGSAGAEIEKIHLTASGGPFRTWTKEQIARATPGQALKHPKWNMGAKITIDSATMMNKCLEIIEARWLFGTPGDKINVVIHPESIIHSMVEYADGAVIAQMGHPDMREPIQFALCFPHRMTLSNKKLDFAQLGSLSFFAPDRERFPSLDLAYMALDKGGNMACIMNAANEAAVAAYLKGRIGFYTITDIVSECMNGSDFDKACDLDTIFRTNDAVLAKASELIDRQEGRRIHQKQ